MMNEITVCDRPSEAPSSVAPSFRVAALASVVGLRDSCGKLPVDACVPVRVSEDLSRVVEARTLELLSQIDGVRSLEEIAERVKLSVPDAIGTCLDLVALGVVSLPMET